MSSIEKRILIDELTERVFHYDGDAPSTGGDWPGLIAARDVHHLLDRLAYTCWLYTLTGLSRDALANLQLDFDVERGALLKQRHDVQLAMTWQFRADDTDRPRLTLDGDHLYWSQC